MTLRDRLETLGQTALLIFILTSAAFLSAITAMRIAIHGRETTMPNLIGKNVSEANTMLRTRGLVLRVADRVYSDAPINVVVRQTPTAGLLMKVSQQAHVVLSLGQRQLEIPLLEGNSLRVSRIELLRAGLQVGEVSEVTMPDEPVDTVVLRGKVRNLIALYERGVELEHRAALLMEQQERLAQSVRAVGEVVATLEHGRAGREERQAEATLAGERAVAGPGAATELVENRHDFTAKQRRLGASPPQAPVFRSRASCIRISPCACHS